MERNSAERTYKIIMLMIITIIVTSLVTAFATYHYMTNNVKFSKKDTDLNGLEYTLSMFRKELEETYMGEINDEELIEGAMKGYIEALGDPYTVYYTKEEMDEIMQETDGSYVGIGVYIMQDVKNDAISIVSPIADSPAEEVGLLPGDIIKKVDGISYSGSQMEEASNKIKGEEGTKVTLEILRGTETKVFEITRKKIVLEHIIAKKLENNIGYIQILDFEGECAKEFQKKYEGLKKQGITKLIVDLRNNGGGLVNESIKIADFFTKKDETLLITADKNGKEEVTKATSDPIIELPVVLLVNEYSASASEIFAGALKDNKIATLVGETTYGKGIIQTLQRLSDGSGLKITTEKYYTPNRNEIHKIGITPDIKVELKEDEDTQLQKAIEVLKKK